MITDGLGTIYEAEITNPHRKHCAFRILREEKPEPLHEGRVHIAIAPTKNIDRLEWMLEKCTEMGVDEITPVLCRYSERKTVNLERLQKIIVSASKQSLKATFPRLNSLTPIADLIANAPEQDRLFAHCMDTEPSTIDKNSSPKLGEVPAGQRSVSANYEPTASKPAIHHHIHRGHSVVILIGPEGDFSPEELQLALANGWQPVSLGKARLRTETAGLVACHTALLLNEND